jgi:peptidoglycan/LPS O-acetylase OafA/YrhL
MLRIARRLGSDLPAAGLRTFVLTTVLTVAVAAASWRLFERPIKDLKRRIVYGAPDPALAFQPGSGAAR